MFLKKLFIPAGCSEDLFSDKLSIENHKYEERK